jgi:sugar transferase (PEP-CTERM/EpsH1 system associated)
MHELLFLSHRIPYPPNKGDKIRSYHVLKRLARDYRVHLGAFVDDADDWRHLPELEKLCASVCLVPLHPLKGKLRSLSAFVSGEPLTLPYYRSIRLARWVRRHLASGTVQRAFVFSSAMAQYLVGADGMRRVLDFVDVDSEKWRQYAGSHRFPMNAVYRREAETLLGFEREQAMHFDASLFVTEAEAALFRRLAPEAGARVGVIENGVDGDYFSPHRDYPDPYAPGAQVLVFTGAMDYWANVDAVRWFAHEVFPAVRARASQAEFHIVGARPTEAVRRLGGQEGVRVTGAVDDMRPYLAHARAAVAPLRIARGVQNKVLEAMAMAKPVLATPQAWDGLRACPELQGLITEDPEVMASRAVDLLSGETREYGERGREFVLQHHDWQKNLDRLVPLIEGKAASVEAPVMPAIAVR